ncbi:MAG: hypothetical protein ACKO23_17315 [Gemmataceae bacterium]
MPGSRLEGKNDARELKPESGSPAMNPIGESYTEKNTKGSVPHEVP